MELEPMLWRIHNNKSCPKFYVHSDIYRQKLLVQKMVWDLDGMLFEFKDILKWRNHRPYVTLKIHDGWQTSVIQLETPVLGRNYVFEIKCNRLLIGETISGCLYS